MLPAVFKWGMVRISISRLYILCCLLLKPQNKTIAANLFVWWFKPQGEDSKTCQIEFDLAADANGTRCVEKKSTFVGAIRIKCSRIGPIDDLRIPCFVKDMAHPLFLSITGLVRGVSIDYYVIDKNDNE